MNQPLIWKRMLTVIYNIHLSLMCLATVFLMSSLERWIFLYTVVLHLMAALCWAYGIIVEQDRSNSCPHRVQV